MSVGSLNTSQAAAARVVLVRHGVTQFNAQRRIQGHLDTPLSEAGLDQAQRLVAGLQGFRFDAVYCSDLLRTRQTLAPYADRAQIEASFTATLRERHFGRFEGHVLDQLALTEPALVQRFRERDADYDLDGGESMRAFFDRSVAAVSSIAMRHAGKQVLLVTHGGVLDCMQRWARDLSLTAPRDFDIHNASINQVSVGDGACRIDAWGDIAHLE